MFICKYCGKTVGNKGCLVSHEKHCRHNPNRIQSKRPHLTEEHKQHIRLGLAKWRQTHHDEFLQYSRGKSKCCENFKNMLHEAHISFIEEYAPFLPDRLYSLDVAFPKIKIGIEINGSQHYKSNGELNDITLVKQHYFEDRGWKIIQIYYKDCYNATVERFEDIFKLPIRDTKYIESDILSIRKRKEASDKQKFELKEAKRKQQEIVETQNKQIVYDLVNNSGIDFTHSGWSQKAQEFVYAKNHKWKNGIFRIIRRYYPEFLKQDNVWKRKGSNY